MELDLNGKWQFREYPTSARRVRDLDDGQWIEGNVPSSIYCNLTEAGVIDKGKLEANPEEFAWVSDKPWIFRKSFEASTELLNCGKVELVFDGLDTIATVWLNGKVLGKAANMFVAHRFDVTGQVVPGENVVMVKFDPPIECAKRLRQRYGDFGGARFIAPYRVYVRKAQYQFGWDWGPALPGCGIWRGVRIVAIRGGRINDLHVRTIDINDKWADVKVGVSLQRQTDQALSCELSIRGHGAEITQRLEFERGESLHSTVIRINKPALWWPAGYGQANLYSLNAELSSNDESVDRAEKEFGIRQIELDQTKDEDGRRFGFRVNGRDIRVRGANWIPLSMYAGSAGQDDYQQLLDMAAGANMNMVRVWGGGYYENECFYQICDRLGLMVWQDFMFACGYYPDRRWFLEEVKSEAATVIRRLRSHASLALWCGNNENDWLHSIDRFAKGSKFYGSAIYHKLLPMLTSELDPDTGYVYSSPCGQAKNPNDRNSGAYHEWQVWAYDKPLRDYLCDAAQVPRFVTEFGLQSMPAAATVQRFSSRGRLGVGKSDVEKHNYQLNGNSKLYRYTADMFGPTEDMEKLIYYSQLMQARGVKSYIERLRASDRNSGAMFWQLHDCFPAISWSAIDYLEIPKALYYYCRRAYAPVLVTAQAFYGRAGHNEAPCIESIIACAVNDSPRQVTANLCCRLMRLDGKVLDELSSPVAIGASGYSGIKLPRSMVEPQEPQCCCLYLCLKNGSGEITAENIFYYVPDKYMEALPPDVKEQVTAVSEKVWKISLHSEAIARDVEIITEPRAKLSDNFLTLLPEQTKHVLAEFSESVPQLQIRLRRFLHC